jgi:NAD kinase
VIERGKSGIARLDISLDEQKFLKLLADGIIICSSSGSTAYSLSAGGSILHPKVEGTMLTPICSITTSIKPVVVPEFLKIKVKASEDARSHCNLSIDGHTIITMENTDSVEVHTSVLPMEFYMAGDINPLTHWVKKLGDIYNYQNPF